MKKKLALAAVIILLLSVAGYGTYAYLTAGTTAKNVITAGTVKIELTEVSDELEVSQSLGSDEPSAYVMPHTEKPGHV
ncbi:MAG: SipW-dependent-type signal peptide-containing protein, partial [Oscillospiraceae bacterium]